MIRIGIIGAGHLGKIHISLLKEIKAFEVVGFYDPDENLRTLIEKEFDLKAYESYESLLKNCAAIDIVCPTPFHFDYAQKAIKAGKHVFVEKPVTIEADEVRILMQLCHEAGVVAQVGHVEQFNPAILAARPHLTRPLFISAERLALYNPRGTDVSVVLDLMIHDIDLILSMIKSNIKKIQASGTPVICETTDIAHARIDFDNGSIATLTVSRVALHNRRSLQVFQKESFLSIDLLHKTLVKAELKEDASGSETENIMAIRNNRLLVKENILIKPVNAIRYEFELFADAILHNKKAVITLDEAYKTMLTAHQIMKAIGH